MLLCLVMNKHPINPQLSAITTSLFRVSAKVLIFQDGKLLVVREDQGWFGLPGGGIDHGEDIHAGLVRELYEEVGCIIEASSISPLPIYIDTTGVIDGIPRLTLLYEKADYTARLEPSQQELGYRWVSSLEFDTLELAPNISPMRSIVTSLFSSL